jgi:hypothetical protein
MPPPLTGLRWEAKITLGQVMTSVVFLLGAGMGYASLQTTVTQHDREIAKIQQQSAEHVRREELDRRLAELERKIDLLILLQRRHDPSPSHP